jgi:hypothetical protein
MTIILSKRELLKGLFAAPALVAATSLMPIKPAASGIFKLESFTEVPSYMDWNLIREKNGNYAWMKNSDIRKFINEVDVIKEIKMPLTTMHDFKGNNKLTVDLMKLHSCSVIHELPMHYTKSLII